MVEGTDWVRVTAVPVTAGTLTITGAGAGSAFTYTGIAGIQLTGTP